ncbi:MAG: DedA family protein [Candidatus Sericytochromatia bacterium]
MILESMIAPLPSEAVMPFAGFLIHEGKMSWAGVAISSTLGSMVGSIISYYLGVYGGKPLVQKFGKYLLLNEEHLDLTEKFFGKYGELTVFVSRFIPVVRHFISIPAGVGRMSMTKFLIYTALGACGWNVFLAWVGYIMKDNWEKIHHYTKFGDIIVVLVALVLIGLFIKKRLNASKT